MTEEHQADADSTPSTPVPTDEPVADDQTASPDESPQTDASAVGDATLGDEEGGDGDGAQAAEAEAAEPEAPVGAMHRRAPRYGRFILTGILIAGIIAFVTAIISAGQSGYRSADIFWILMLWFAPFGILFGALTALAIDRRSMKRADKQLEASGE